MKSKCLKLESDDIKKIDLKEFVCLIHARVTLVLRMLSALKSVLSLT